MAESQDTTPLPEMPRPGGLAARAQGLSMPDEREGLHCLAIALAEQLEAIGLGMLVEDDEQPPETA